jgi:NADPH-dependent curcumin reductase CurA
VPERNRRIVLVERPTGSVEESTVRLEETDAPVPGDGEALVRNRYLSIDPTIRTWMDDVPGYLPPIGIGEVVRSAGVAEVIESRSDRYTPGDLVFGLTGWQDYALGGSGTATLQTLPQGIDPTAALSVFGTTGMTAYFGLLDVGEAAEGDTVVVSGAAGAVGSVVGQIARIKGCRVVGIAGGPEKCEWVAGELGFDGCIDYKAGDVAGELRERCPEGIDVYFDNVGGEILDAALARLARGARVVLCGAISQYYNLGSVRGPANYLSLLVNRARMQGFVVLDYLARYAEAQREMAAWIGDGRLIAREDVVEGFVDFPDALARLFAGENVG